jgi:hypothetical protein
LLYGDDGTLALGEYGSGQSSSTWPPHAPGRLSVFLMSSKPRHGDDWLGAIAITFAGAFAILGLCQLIRRGSIRSVDHDILPAALYMLYYSAWAQLRSRE